jgi:hypothetical protein
LASHRTRAFRDSFATPSAQRVTAAEPRSNDRLGSGFETARAEPPIGLRRGGDPRPGGRVDRIHRVDQPAGQLPSRGSEQRR